MHNRTIITSAKEIDLRRHGVIEAHAGTGKTYTIVNLVLEMLTRGAENGVCGFIHLREILLVTYTEKAAGELKKRIQDGILERIKNTNDRELAQHLENCLNNMHEAFIGTIHSVCLRLLQTWPLESGIHFDTRMIDDNEGLRITLRESMRTDWQDESTNIPQALSAIEKEGIALEDKHYKLINQVAKRFLNSDEQLDMPLENLPVYTFIISAARALAARYERRKKQNGLISYDDMLHKTLNAVNANNSAILQTLKKRLRYGIIDEFQDTSPVQWKIFKKIFLDDQNNSLQTPTANPVMYIVGDPKQSIYSVQNADIQSYLNALAAIENIGGCVYSLVYNYRTLPETIAAYNAVLCGDEDWFCYGKEGGVTYSKDQSARPPNRDAPQYPLKHSALQTVEITGKNGAEQLADAVCVVIKSLLGKTLSIPRGTAYENITLSHKDFAVITETNVLAKPFIAKFTANGIPCVKYKMDGVFESDIARDLIALLKACVRKKYRVAALLTHFFNRPPESINPETDLTPCADQNCEGGEMCAAHAFDLFAKLASRQLWAQLFENIFTQTKIRQRLIRLIDGERKLADLRQVVDYCVEYLYTRNSNIEHLIAHLERLYKEEEQAAQDKNIHVLSTEKSCVSILTMHKSKGLEFPVVFMVTRDGVRLPKSPNILRYTGGENKRCFAPYLTAAQKTQERETLDRAIALYTAEQERERRRLLYVAMTRPQALLVAPCRDGEKDLSPRLKELTSCANDVIKIFDVNDFTGDNENAPRSSNNSVNAAQKITLDEIPKINLRDFIRVETSYTQLCNQQRFRGTQTNLFAADNSEEALPTNETHNSDTIEESGKDSALPGGRLAGIALHGIIETILGANDAVAILNDDAAFSKIIEKHLYQNGIYTNDAARVATGLVKDALTATYKIDNGGASCDVVVSQLPQKDKLCEAEFLFSAAPHRVCGFMDLLFRVKNDAHPAHPYRYSFIDWKSDTLANYDEKSLRDHCVEKNYKLQSTIYATALDKFLAGILGERYNREENLGASVYVFLRGGSGAYIVDDVDLDFDVNKHKIF